MVFQCATSQNDRIGGAGLNKLTEKKFVDF